MTTVTGVTGRAIYNVTVTSVTSVTWKIQNPIYDNCLHFSEKRIYEYCAHLRRGSYQNEYCSHLNGSKERSWCI